MVLTWKFRFACVHGFDTNREQSELIHSNGSHCRGFLSFNIEGLLLIKSKSWLFEKTKKLDKAFVKFDKGKK